MKNNLHSLIALLMLAVSSLAASAQDTTSPYSRFGYGLLNDNATSAQSQMGGVGYAMRSGRQINAMNPASYALADSLTFLFDMGVDLTFVHSTEGSVSRNSTGGGVDYITMQFPLGSRMGMSIGLLPYSSVGYSFGSAIENGSSSHEGTGGLNKLYLGIGGRIISNLAIGANISYLFGTTYHDVYATQSVGNPALFEQITQVRDFHLDFGVQYSVNIGRKNRLTAGLTYSPAKTLLGHTWIQKYIVNTDEAPDTLNYTRLRGNYSLPETWGAGLAYEWNSALTAEVDFTYQPWSKAKLMAQETFVQNRFADRYKFAAGLSWQPKARGSYFQRVTYRIGGHFTRDYMVVNHAGADYNVNDYGISCGFGLPAPMSKTVVNLGFEWLRRATSSSAIVAENYFNIRLGINFNQTWFMKSQLK
ncbi:MAG: hypothetical protein HDS92_01450 [Bacteroidales bacterium]|nr:hypothetical protein [Bacteroidales bacterium]